MVLDSQIQEIKENISFQINLSRSHIGDEGTIKLALAMKQNSSLIFMRITQDTFSHCSICDKIAGTGTCLQPMV